VTGKVHISDSASTLPVKVSTVSSECANSADIDDDTSCTYDIDYAQAYSYTFQTLCGVRQGGILSPYLFTLHVDDLIKKLRSSGYGLHNRLHFVC